MKNKFHNRRTQLLILLVCLTILTTIAIRQTQTTTEAQTIPEKRYEPIVSIAKGHTGPINSVEFSPDNSILASGSNDETIKLWDVETGLLLRSIGGHNDYVWAVAFSPNGKILATGSKDTTIKLWDVQTGQLIKSLFGNTEPVADIAFSPNGKMIASGGWDSTVKIWDVETAKQITSLVGHKNSILSVDFSPDNSFIASASEDHTLKLWDIEKKIVLQTFFGHKNMVNSVAFSSDGQKLASGSSDMTSKVWDVKTGQLIKSIKNGGDRLGAVLAVSFFNKGKSLISSDDWGRIRIWDIETEKIIKVMSYASGGHSLSFTFNEKYLASGNFDSKIYLWNIENGRLLKKIESHYGYFNLNSVFSPNRKILASLSKDNEIVLWNLETGQNTKTLIRLKETLNTFFFSRDGKILMVLNGDETITYWDIATGQQIKTLDEITWDEIFPVLSDDKKISAVPNSNEEIELWDEQTGKRIRSLAGHKGGIIVLTFSPDGKVLASSGQDSKIKLWSVETGQLLKEFDEYTGAISFSPDGKLLLSVFGDLTYWDVESGKVIARLGLVENDNWALFTPNGKFDASPDALKFMYFTVFDPLFGYEIIEFNQLKSKSLTPGLLRDIYAGTRTSGADSFTITLYPTVEIGQTKEKPNVLNLKLTNRGGGIGRIEIFLNGTEFLADAREGKSFNKNASAIDLAVEIPKEKLASGANKIEVIAWNAEGDVRSRSNEYFLSLDEKGTVRGTKVFNLQEKPQSYEGHFYAIVAGVSDYAGDFDLGFAAKDAEDMSRALALGARRLFCSKEMASKKPCERVHVRLLSTEKETPFEIGDVDFKRSQPKKQNLQEVFAEVAAKATPDDVIIVYFAGHGLAISSNEALAASAFPDLYIFPTMEAGTLDKKSLGNKDLLKANYVTSLELADWMKQIRAQKKAMIFDTCASGAVQTDLAKLTREGDDDKLQIRALDRLRERTGFYVLMGSAADAVSYEAGKFRQGLLTYSLLSAMSGEKLRDEKFVDVEDWFKYAEETVDVLAKDIGGVQRPRWFKSNFNTQSFDVGQFEQKDYENFKLAQPVPTILQPRFLDKVNISDTLKLEQTIISKLRESSINAGRGAENAIKFVPVPQAKGGIVPSGLYTVSGENVVVELVLLRDEKEIAKLEVKGTKNDIAEKIFEAIISAARIK